MAKANKGVRYNPGFVFDRKGNQITNQEDAWAEGAECGCGIDCCNNTLVLKDRSTGDVIEIFVEDGAIKFRNRATDAITEVAVV